MVSNDNIGQAKRISYQIGTNKVDQTSAPMEHLYLKNAVGCTVYKDIKSCQSCNNGFLLQRAPTGINHNCVESCAPGTYANFSIRSCENCLSSC